MRFPVPTFSVLIASFLLMGLASPSPSPSPPVVATRCDGGVTSIEMTEHASYDAIFHNNGDVAADEIHVAIPYGRHRFASFDVKQTFPPHADTDVHLHKNLSGGLYAYETDRNACIVQYVHFVDGTQWSALP